MISYNCIWAVALRHLRILKHDPNLLFGSLYWPLLDILIWGYLGNWIAQSQTSDFVQYQSMAILGVLLWQVVGRGCNIIVISLAEELWSGNIINLFSLPIRIVEWILGVILLYAIMILLVFSFCIGLVYVLYDISIVNIIAMFLLFSPPLFMCGIWLGFICLQIVALLGKRGTELAFIVAWFFMPFSGAYYPVEILPTWGQTISRFLPMSYVFTSMRDYMMYQKNPILLLSKGFLLSCVYAMISIGMFMYCFQYSKRKGLARLTD